MMRGTVYSIFKNHTQAILEIATKEPISIAPDGDLTNPEFVLMSYDLYEKIKP